jgi:membrane-associated PAP2 superfamily phosphatase
MRSSGFAVFILFFGVALIEAIQKHDWLEASLFLALGVLFLVSDTRRRQVH